MTDRADATGLKDTLAANIERLAARRRREEAAGSASDRLAGAITGFTGSMRFVALHLLLFGGWIAINLGAIPGIRPFDRSFVVLAMVASVEAIFLSTFVLISQNRQAIVADRRADLDLHINLLAEHELSRLATLIARIAERLEVTIDDPAEIRAIGEDVQPERVLDALAEERPAP